MEIEAIFFGSVFKDLILPHKPAKAPTSDLLSCAVFCYVNWIWILFAEVGSVVSRFHSLICGRIHF
jgi:hypothetical protein